MPRPPSPGLHRGDDPGFAAYEAATSRRFEAAARPGAAGDGRAQAFRSRAHPAGAPWALVYGRALVRPLAWCVLPLMLGATTAALQAGLVLPFLTWGLPLAVACATAWTRLSLGATPAAVHVRPGAVAVASVVDVLRGRPLAWQPLWDLRVNAHVLLVTAGHATTRLDRAAWPDAKDLRHALEDARMDFRYG